MNEREITYTITEGNDCYVVEIDESFYCTADTFEEAVRELNDYMGKRNLDWETAEDSLEDHVAKFCAKYLELSKRYYSGERTPELYNEMTRPFPN